MFGSRFAWRGSCSACHHQHTCAPEHCTAPCHTTPCTHPACLPTPQALEKLSHDHPGSLLRSGALLAVLSYVDFFQTGVQRVAVATAANMCRGLTVAEHADAATAAAPILINLLQYQVRCGAVQCGACGTGWCQAQCGTSHCAVGAPSPPPRLPLHLPAPPALLAARRMPRLWTAHAWR